MRVHCLRVSLPLQRAPGVCDAADFAYIRRGHFGNVKMDGFKAVVVGDLIGKDHSKVHGTVYFDEKTTPAQQEAFRRMLAFMFAWNPPRIENVKVVPIDFTESADHNTYTLSIPGILGREGCDEVRQERQSAAHPPRHGPVGQQDHLRG